METVGNFPDLASARVAQSLLEAEGIEAIIPDEYMGGVDWQMISALHGLRLQVRPEEAEDARALLAELNSPLLDERIDAPDEGQCSACGSTRLAEASWVRRVKVLILFFPPLLLLWPVLAFFGSRLRCAACGHRWQRGAA